MMSTQPKRFEISSTDHAFVGRILDLSIVGLSFGSYDDAVSYPDVKYVLDVNDRTGLLISRVESLNHVGGLLWPKSRTSLKSLPISAFEYCNFLQDAFLMRTVSVLDCCCLLATEVLELDIDPRKANPSNIRKFSNAHPCCDPLDGLSDIQIELRTERNVRFHRGEEEPFTDDDTTFKTVALFAQWGRDLTGKDMYGRKINLRKYYDQTISGLRTKFNINVEKLSGALDGFYGSISCEFEQRWRRKRQSPSAFDDKANLR